MNTLHIVYLSFLILCLLLSFYLRRSYRKRTQNSGELQVWRVLEKYCANRDAHIMSNITLRLVDGSTTQIDCILVCTKGVFVIEVKNYNGWIFANSQSKAWTQIFYYMKFRFQNPLYQNYKHVKAVQILFDFLEPRLVHNIVVFTGKAVFKTPIPKNVYSIKELIHTIEQYQRYGRCDYYQCDLQSGYLYDWWYAI